MDLAREHRIAAWTALFVTFLWSSSWVLIRWGLDDEELPPITFAALRYGLGAMLIVAWVVARERPRGPGRTIDRRLLIELVALGLVLVAVSQGAQFVALDHQPAAATSLVLALTPLCVALVAAVSLAERPSSRQLLGVALVVVGAVLFFAGDLWATSLGMAAAITSLAANVGGSVIGRHVNRQRRLSPSVVTAISMGVGAVVLVAAALLLEGVPTLTARAWLLIGWLAVVNTALAFTLWNRSLQRLTAVESASINNTMLVQVALLAWLFLGEWPGLAGIAGILVVSLGVLLAQRQQSVSAPEPDIPGEGRSSGRIE
jgi:drug/metabolite transporter (DMT)-like permease